MSCLSHKSEHVKVHRELVPLEWQFIGWLFLILFYLTYKELIIGDAFGNYMDFLILMGINVLSFYLNVLWLFPKVVENNAKRFYTQLLFLLLEILVLSVLLVLVSMLLGGLTIDFSGNGFSVFIANFFEIVFIHVVGLFLSVGYYWFVIMLSERKAKEVLGEENIELENQFKVLEQDWLKAQLPNHFLRNTLMMLRYTIRNEPEIGEKCVHLLSEMLRYYVEGTKDGLILLSTEIDQLKCFVALLDLKAEQEMNLTLDIQGDYSTIRTVPMIALTLAENITKYGILGDPNKPAEISIYIKQQQVHIEAQNSISLEADMPSTGIGLQNLRKRLNYFHENNHSFLVENTGDHFRVEICINL